MRMCVLAFVLCYVSLLLLLCALLRKHSMHAHITNTQMHHHIASSACAPL